MPFIQARAKITNGNGQVVTKDGNILNVNKDESVLDKKDLTSDKLILLSGIPSDRFYFVAGDKLLIRKYTSPEVLSSVINITKTGWYTYSEFAPAGMKTADYQKDAIGYGYYIEPKEYTGDRYYGGSMVSLMRISSIKFCSRFIHCGSPLAPAGIQDKFSALIMWGEVDAQGNSALKIPAHLEDMSGLFDMGMTIDALFTNLALPKIITLGKPKKMHRTFYNAFSYGMFTYSPPVDAVVFGEMDVSEVTDFSYCFGQCFQANPDIENWDVSSATNMTGMFGIVVDWSTDKWTRNLSKWCVSKITSEPANFALNHPMSAAQKPVWGTCPSHANMGKWDYSEFVLELNSGHSGQEILVYFQNSVTGNYALFSDFRIADPNLIVNKAAIAPKTGTNAGASLRSNGKAGMLALRCVGDYDTIHVWTWIGGTAVIKRIHSFGNLVKHVKLPITGFNYDAPDNILPNIKSVQFGLPTVTSKFNSQRITGWDVSNLTSMVNMFLNCVDFNQDLSKWCVPQFSSEPHGFSTGAPLTQANKPVWGTCPRRAVMGEWDYEDLTLEYQTGYTGRSCTVFFNTVDGQVAQVADITINDPNGVLTVTNTTSGNGKALKFASTGKAGLVSIRLPARFTTFVIWDDTGLVNGNGYPALKGFRSFGNTLRDILLGLIPYNYQVPTNIPATLRTIRFNLNSIVASTRFNDPNITGWDVSKLDPSSFNEMLMDCWAFNQDLSGWCVSQVTSPPANFATRSALAQAYHPVWGTCPSTIAVLGYSIGNKAGRANNNHIDVFDNIGADDWIYISYTLSAVKAGDVVAWKTQDGSYLNSNGQVDKATIYQLPEQASVNGTNSIVFNKAASSAIVTWRMDEAFQQSVATHTDHVILYINGVERLRLNVTVLGQR